MRSPFPGMDPYLEQQWEDLHTALIAKSRTFIQRQLGGDLVAKIEQRVLVEDAIGYSRAIRPDIYVSESTKPTFSSGSTATAESEGGVRLIEKVEPITERFIEILDISTGGRVITSIEFVSPSNKVPGDGLQKYMVKQDECYQAKVSLVEIDLTRTGTRKLLAHRWRGARQYEATYQASIWWSAYGSSIDLFPMPLEKHLLTLPIPLRVTDKPAMLNVQAVLDECYTDARYDLSTDYGKPCAPPLEGAELEASQSFLKVL